MCGVEIALVLVVWKMRGFRFWGCSSLFVFRFKVPASAVVCALCLLYALPIAWCAACVGCCVCGALRVGEDACEGR